MNIPKEKFLKRSSKIEMINEITISNPINLNESNVVKGNEENNLKEEIKEIGIENIKSNEIELGINLLIIEDKKEETHHELNHEEIINKEKIILYKDLEIQCEIDPIDKVLLNKDQILLDESNLCVICYKQYHDAVLIPCGHTNFCFQCLTEINERKIDYCPICLNPFHNFIKIYGQI